MIGEKNNTPRVLKIDEWDTELPTGDWSGPEPLPLFPSLDLTDGQADKISEFRELHIQYNPDADQDKKITEWVNDNIPKSIKWLFHGLEVFHPQFQKIFFALPSVHVLDEGDDSKLKKGRPEIYEDDWDTQLDLCRDKFLKYLEELGCSFQFITENEAIDNGMLIFKEYARPRIIGSQDTYPGTSNPPKKLWRYLTLTKFLDFLQSKTIWFSRPQFFDDPHEFTMDEPSQRELLQWKLDSFAREYNRAVTSKRDHYVTRSNPMTIGLPIDKTGKINKCSIKLSDVSDTLLSSIRKDIRSWQESFCISCWRYSPYDSVAIWNQYTTLNEGIAIVADLDALRNSFKKVLDIRLAVIEYRDFSDDSNDPMNSNPLTYKDVRYASEEEARFYFRANLGDRKGVSVPIDVSQVMSEVHLSPNASNEFKRIIQGLLNVYDLKVPLVESSLGKMPNKF